MKELKKPMTQYSKAQKDDDVEEVWTRDNTRRRLKRMRAHRRRRR